MEWASLSIEIDFGILQFQEKIIHIKPLNNEGGREVIYTYDASKEIIRRPSCFSIPDAGSNLLNLSNDPATI